MKKTTLLAALAAIVLVACQKENADIPARPAAETSTKVINISISQGNYYDDEVYDGLEATARIHVAMVSKNDGATIVLWDTTFANQSIRLYPRPHQPFTFTKTFTGINDHDELVTLGYTIVYKDSRNQQSAEAKNDFIPWGNSNFSFYVRL